jgi:hypothetical protein
MSADFPWWMPPANWSASSPRAISFAAVKSEQGASAIVAVENVTGVKTVHDHLCWVDAMSGMYLNSPEDEGLAKAS